MEREKEALFHLVFKDARRITIQFNSVEQLKSFIDKEYAFWSWINNVPNFNHHPFHQYYPQYFNSLHQLKNDLKRILNIDPISVNEKQSVSQLLSNVYSPSGNQEGLPLSSDPISIYILSISQYDAPKALYGLLYLLYPNLIVQFPQAFSAAILIELFKFGVKETAEVSMRAMTSLVTNMVAQLESAKAEQKDFSNEFSQSLLGLQKKSEDVILDISNSYGEIESRLKKDHDNIIRAYKNDIALKEPVTYWENKGKKHDRQFFGMLTLCLVAGCIFVFGIYEIIFKILKLGEKTVNVYDLQSVFILLSIFMAVWLIRIIVRLMLSHFHLALDSKERATMVKTYLALISEGKGLDNENRTLMLSALFRPSTTGIVKDDPIPPSWMSMVTSHKN